MMDEIKINGYYRDLLMPGRLVKVRYVQTKVYSNEPHRYVHGEVYYRVGGYCEIDVLEKGFKYFFEPVETKEAKAILKAWGYGK